MIRNVLPRAILLLALSAGLPSVAVAAAVPPCAGSIEVASAPIVRVEDDGVLVLEDGRAADLEGILLPDGKSDGAPDVYKRKALDMIRALATGNHVTVAVERPKEDRYGRLRAQVFVDDGQVHDWIQRELLREGLARVDVAPDRQQCASGLYAAEREAREHHLGIWSSPAYAIRAPDALNAKTGTFQIVEGTVKSVHVKDGRAFLNFGDDWHHTLTAIVAPADMPLFRARSDDPKSLEGVHVRVRGWLERGSGPEIQIAAPQAIEVIGPSSAIASGQ